jgi:hypothetical protein
LEINAFVNSRLGSSSEWQLTRCVTSQPFNVDACIHREREGRFIVLERTNELLAVPFVLQPARERRIPDSAGSLCAIAIVRPAEGFERKGGFVNCRLIYHSRHDEDKPINFSGSYRCHAYVHVESQSKVACMFEMSKTTTTTAKNSLIRVNKYSIDMCIVYLSLDCLMRAEKLTYLASFD